MMRNTLSEKIYRNLFDMLFAGDYAVGNVIPSEIELSNLFGVSRPTIHKAIKRLEEDGYVTSRVGAGTFIVNLPQKTMPREKYLIGLLLPFINREGLFPRLAEEIAAISSRYQISVIMGGQFRTNTFTAEQLNNMADFYIQQHVDGVIFSPVEQTEHCKETNQEIVNKLAAHNIAVVVIDSNYVEYPENNEADVIRIDNIRAGYKLAECFIHRGFERIDFFMPRNTGQTVRLRLLGVKAALADHNILFRDEWLHQFSGWDDAFDSDLRDPNVKHIICSNDYAAIRLMTFLQNAGKHIPADVEIAGFDNSDMSMVVKPSLTTVSQPCDVLAVLALTTLLNRIQNPDAPIREVLSNFTVIFRDSTLQND